MTAGWSPRQLGEICLKITDGSHNPPKGVDFSEFVMLSSRNVLDDQITTDSPRYLSPIDYAIENKRTDLRPGDVLLTIVGTVGRAAVVPHGLKNVTLQRSVAVLRPDSAIVDSRFLMFCLQCLAPELQAQSQGVAQKGIYLKALSAVTIPLPPLEEQRRIVAVLDEAFAAIAAATANAEKNLANAKELLLNAVDRELSGGGSGWLYTTLEAICARFEYGTSAKSQPAGAVPVLRMGNLQSGEIDWSDLVFTNDQAEISQLALRPKDVLFNRTNSLEHVGKAAIFRGNRPAIFAGYLIRLHYDPTAVDPEFLTLFLNSRPVRAYGRALAGKSVNQANISAGKLRTYPINLPPLSEQHQIVARLADLRQTTGRLQSAQRSKLTALAALKQSLLHRAFTGELTATAPDLIPA